MSFLGFRSLFPLSQLVLAIIVSQAKAQCNSYGIDFQNGGSYFINSADNSDFTTVTEFSNCTGTANVILVAPKSDSWLCSDIATQPDFTNEFSTCPIQKSSMYSGTWTIVILDNNGDDPSFAAQRSFELIVAPQQTVLYTPTITITNVTTPLSASTSTVSYDEKTTASDISTTIPSATASQTRTITPQAITQTTTSTHIRTITVRKWTKSITTTTTTATCSTYNRQSTPDPWPKQNVLALAQSKAAIPASRKERDAEVDVARVISNRAVVRALNKRAPDVPTVTVTDTNTADWITSTTISTAPTSIITAFTTTTIDITINPTITIYSGITTETITAPTPISTRTSHVVVATTTTLTITKPITITKETILPSLASYCTAHGGFIV